MNEWLHKKDSVIVDHDWLSAASYRMTKWPNFNVINIALQVGIFQITRRSADGLSVDVIPLNYYVEWKKNSHLNVTIAHHAVLTPIMFCARHV